MTRFRNPAPQADETPLDPAALAELDQLDAALRGEPIDDARLAALVRDVQAAAPVLEPAARTALNERFAARTERAARAGRPRRRSALVASGALGSVLAGIVIVGSLQQHSGGVDPSGAGPVAVMTDRAATESAGGGDDRSAGATADSADQLAAPATAPPSAPAESTARERRVERVAQLTVRVAQGRLDDAAREVESITRAAGGYVAESQLDAGAASQGRPGAASFTLRVRAARLDDAIGRLGKLGTITGQQRSSEDITALTDSAARRLRDAGREREALLRALAGADREAEIGSLRRRLDDNRRLRAGLRAEAAELDRRADLATVTLTLTTAGQGDAIDDDGVWGIGDALGDAGRALELIGGVLVIALTIALPFAALAAAGWAAARRRRRRLRDACLG